MTPEQAQAAYRGARHRMEDGLLEPEAFQQIVCGLRWQDSQRVWWQIDPRTGAKLRWSGSAWERPGTNAGRRAAVPRGGNVVEPEPPAQSAGATKQFLTRMLALLGVALLGYQLLPKVFGHSAAVALLMAATAAMLWAYRQVLAAGLRALDRMPLFEPVWSMHAQMDPRLRKLGGVLVPMALGYTMAPALSVAFADSGVLVFLTALAVNTVVAHFFFGPAPQSSAGRKP